MLFFYLLLIQEFRGFHAAPVFSNLKIAIAWTDKCVLGYLLLLDSCPLLQKFVFEVTFFDLISFELIQACIHDPCYVIKKNYSFFFIPSYIQHITTIWTELNYCFCLQIIWVATKSTTGKWRKWVKTTLRSTNVLGGGDDRLLWSQMRTWACHLLWRECCRPQENYYPSSRSA